MIKNILLTGATGFLGGHLINDLNDNNIKIYALIRDKNDIKKLNSNITPVLGDFNNLDWMNNLQKIDVIIHTAAIVKHSRRNPDQQIDFNIKSTLELVKLANKHSARMIFISSSGTVGCTKNDLAKLNEESNYSTFYTKNWPYYFSKIEAEKKAIELSQQLNVKLTVFRPPVMLGPGDHKLRSTGNIYKFLNKKFPFLIKGNITFCDIRDVSKAVVNSIKLENPKMIYNVPGHSMSLDKFFDLCENISGVKKPRFTLSTKLVYPISVIAENIFHFIGKHSPIPDPVVVEMIQHYWDIKSLYVDELNYKLRKETEILEDTISWIFNNT